MRTVEELKAVLGEEKYNDLQDKVLRSLREQVPHHIAGNIGSELDNIELDVLESCIRDIIYITDLKDLDEEPESEHPPLCKRSPRLLIRSESTKDLPQGRQEMQLEWFVNASAITSDWTEEDVAYHLLADILSRHHRYLMTRDLLCWSTSGDWPPDSGLDLRDVLLGEDFQYLRDAFALKPLLRELAKSQRTEDIVVHLTISPGGAYAIPPVQSVMSENWRFLDRDCGDVERKILFVEKGVLRERCEPVEGYERFVQTLRQMGVGETDSTELPFVEKRAKKDKKKAKAAVEESSSA